MKRKLKLLSLFPLAWFLIHSIYIVIDGLCDESQAVDIAIILGNKVNEDGNLSPRLKARVDRGLDLYEQGLCKRILVSGGLGKEGHLEGDVMAQYLIDKGIPKKAILVDNQGNNTKATADNFKALNLETSSIVLVSQYYHISRCKLAFSKLGFQEVHGAHAYYFELRDFYAIFREFFGYYKYLFFY